MRFRKIPLATCGREWRGGRETGKRLWTESGEDDGGQTRALAIAIGRLKKARLLGTRLHFRDRERKELKTPDFGWGTYVDSAALLS